MIGKTLTIAGLVAFLCLPARTQEASRFEAGVRGGAGTLAQYDDNPRAAGVFGFEACAFCQGRFGLYGGYSHFMQPGAGSSKRSAELGTLGLRIQGTRRVRPFFDLGLAVAHSRYGWSYTKPVNTVGAELGAGVTILAGPHLYIRPQFRLAVMSELYLSSSAQVGIGWRF